MFSPPLVETRLVSCFSTRRIEVCSSALFLAPFCVGCVPLGCYRIVANVYLSSICPILLFRLPIIWFTDFAAFWSFPLASFVTTSLWSCGLSRAGVQKLREVLPAWVFPVFFFFLSLSFSNVLPRGEFRKCFWPQHSSQ